jgi:MscS family membrane protein
VEFAGKPIENFGRRDRILLNTTIGLRYETSPEQLRGLLAELRASLRAHSLVDRDSARVRFVAFGESSLNLEIFAYLKTADWNTYLEGREGIYLKIMDLVKAAGSDFAFPSRTLYMAESAGGERSPA